METWRHPNIRVLGDVSKQESRFIGRMSCYTFNEDKHCFLWNNVHRGQEHAFMKLVGYILSPC